MHALAASTQHCVCRHQNQSQNINGAIGGQFQMSPAELSVCQSQTIHNSQNQNQNDKENENGDRWTWVRSPICVLFVHCTLLCSLWDSASPRFKSWVALSSLVRCLSVPHRWRHHLSPTGICCFRPYKLALWQFLCYVKMPMPMPFMTIENI